MQIRATEYLRRFLATSVLTGATASRLVAGGLPGPSDSTGAYVGPETCRPCHRTAFETWVFSPHARTSLALGMMAGMNMMGRADERARGTGECFACRPCHAPPGEMAARRFGPDYHAGDGVQCETCHGPGGTHVRIETAKDTLDGHRIYRPPKGNDLCQVCHYDEKPFHTHATLGTPAFEYEAWWKRIAHPTPAGERARR